MEFVPVILAGGSGERLWPLSKADFPKQFATLEEGAASLFQQALQRVADRAHFTAPLVVGAQAHRFIMAEQARAGGIPDLRLILEPLPRNTAPALAIAALELSRTRPEAVMFVMPSDHLIADQPAFMATLATAYAAAQSGCIATFAMQPQAPETGYGYIRRGEPLDGVPGAFRIAAFVEKPDVATAQSYLDSGEYGWNAGIFVLRADVALSALASLAPQMLATCRTAYAAASDTADGLLLPREIMADCPADSIDYAIMEHTPSGAVIPAQIGWSDLGSWTALDDLAGKDAHGNATTGHVFLEDSTGCYVRSHHPVIAGIGLRDLVVVAADHAVLIGPKSRMQDVKKLIAQMRSSDCPDTHLRAFNHRPWGRFYSIDRGPNYQVKRLVIKPGGKISLQSHHHRSEHWVVVAGRATVTHGEQVQTLEANQSTYIPAGTVHRLENRDAQDLIVIEVQTGGYLGEDDIVRYDDLYHRTGENA